MELIRGIHNILPSHNGCVLTIGNFDGVHRGHAQVINNLVNKAKHFQLPAVVMTFEPQPQELFRQQDAPARISLLRDKISLLEELNIDRLLCANFNTRFANQPAEQFIEDLLVNKLGVKYLVVGDDFCFGKNRTGTFDMLLEAGKKFGFTVVSTQSFILGSTRVSSTAVREQLALGNLEQARRLLGHPVLLSGKVAHGQKIGRTIGFPTANIALKRKVSPVRGVFAVKMYWDGSDIYEGVANVGFRPTVEGQVCQLEVHLFDYSGDLYGKRVEVELVAKIRDEHPFESLDALKKQILNDVNEAKALFSNDAG
ncbi:MULTISPECIES: bifunctional riboflavin kinase/FAD synthetase [unclassified Shewanella]|uniref:bifunctional riboflavin kinase/FAD synthetase n=1 Tax=unclassified Shewanella TaxID=196818 RepID=UPI000C85B014|nr:MULTISPECIES: bifunctional riboflavin kinase/FAD synthetase [unclassified Shewanella]MDO6638732.1 bifunctional riboflavin kinase/FAD synthetase [Shewanella sp. 5_MG-2023]MDO6679828.1 bifunctional riboflavin kinase/FAD synthetase [Shewanella sp. 4_MG-2023]MDO6773750.1 bifunctional riboflavin kinase/FAD synthetase [Shewanella sp. 3_MG-2023]PMG31446.1 riboflavin biosynthesis protein RibF [Shewanella sp. 10N.286.52.C2]PMG43194.1 riboflavin biosynthesis protein RibF [Shewanella sp. 10N.286.52.B9